MIEITNFRQGAILNHHHGVETEKSLKVRIEGISDHGYPVTVNGIAAEMDGRRFFADIDLTEKINTVTASTVTPYGNYAQELTLVWDKKSFKRYNFYIDVHIFTFTDLAKERPKSAFDHFYLRGLKNIHEKYGTVFSLNCFYHNAHHEFLLKDMPDIWKSEFTDNADWLKFSFHAYSEFPDRPYAEASAEEIGKDWDLVQNEIYRFAGEAAYIPPCVIHWVNLHPAAAAEMLARGTRCYTGSLRLKVMGGPSLADRQKGGNMNAVQERSMAGSSHTISSLGLKLHYGFVDELSYHANHRNRYEPLLKLYFYANDLCCNLTPINKIADRVKVIQEQSLQYGFENFGIVSHEQYTFPYYPNYLPDHMDRLELAARLYTEAGCKPVFFNDGILGNTTWDKK